MSRGFEAGNRGQLMILPPSIDDWISEGHLVRFLWEAVSQIDLSDFYLSYADEGRPPYDPAVMLSVLLYSYCNGKRSSRKIRTKSNANQQSSTWDRMRSSLEWYMGLNDNVVLSVRNARSTSINCL